MVLDVTGFLADHPGGEKVLLGKAGTDATKAFEAIHKKSGGVKLIEERDLPIVGVLATTANGAAGDKHEEYESTNESASPLLEEACAQVSLNLLFSMFFVVSWYTMMGLW